MTKGPGTPKDGVLVAGDSGNDIELFAVPGVHGCMVANAHPELRAWCAEHAGPKLFQASQDGPGGIFQALEHFGFLTHEEPRPAEVEVRRAVVGMQTAEIDLYCGVLPEASPDHVASLGDVRACWGWQGGGCGGSWAVAVGLAALLDGVGCCVGSSLRGLLWEGG